MTSYIFPPLDTLTPEQREQVLKIMAEMQADLRRIYGDQPMLSDERKQELAARYEPNALERQAQRKARVALAEERLRQRTGKGSQL